MYNFIPKKYTAEIKAVASDFEIRFSDFKKIEKLLEFSSYPFNYSTDHAFSYLKQTKNKHRSRLTDAHTLDSLRLAISNYLPDFANLAEDYQAQCSH
ncbi:unnamed protein product [Euphydryas editha]|uniref:Uncharacterized protein n=1 Tax=Euphydryas editha TaxID=104508 RepID=A0AAU9V0W1_EUPED|nr:unnamed protein product [Euphydryas editha]